MRNIFVDYMYTYLSDVIFSMLPQIIIGTFSLIKGYAHICQETADTTLRIHASGEYLWKYYLFKWA